MWQLRESQLIIPSPEFLAVRKTKYVTQGSTHSHFPVEASDSLFPHPPPPSRQLFFYYVTLLLMILGHVMRIFSSLGAQPSSECLDLQAPPWHIAVVLYKVCLSVTGGGLSGDDEIHLFIFLVSVITIRQMP